MEDMEDMGRWQSVGLWIQDLQVHKKMLSQKHVQPQFSWYLVAAMI
jgi:hypothetical protein